MTIQYRLRRLCHLCWWWGIIKMRGVSCKTRVIWKKQFVVAISCFDTGDGRSGQVFSNCRGSHAESGRSITQAPRRSRESRGKHVRHQRPMLIVTAVSLGLSGARVKAWESTFYRSFPRGGWPLPQTSRPISVTARARVIIPSCPVDHHTSVFWSD